MNEEYLNTLSPQELEERFTLLATDAKEYAIFVLDQDGHLSCWNPGAERLLGYHSIDVIGQHFSRFFSPEDVRNGQPEHELKMALAEGVYWGKNASINLWESTGHGSVATNASCVKTRRR